MPRACTICGHAERAAIDAALASGTAYRAITRQFVVSKDAVARHAREHIAQSVAQSHAAKSESAALDVVAQLKVVNAITLAILKEARDRHDGDLALKAIDRFQRQWELQAKLLGDLDERAHVEVNVVMSQQWRDLRATILDALALYPEARAAVAQALAGGTPSTPSGRRAAV